MLVSFQYVCEGDGGGGRGEGEERGARISRQRILREERRGKEGKRERDFYILKVTTARKGYAASLFTCNVQYRRVY